MRALALLYSICMRALLPQDRCAGSLSGSLSGSASSLMGAFPDTAARDLTSENDGLAPRLAALAENARMRRRIAELEQGRSGAPSMTAPWSPSKDIPAPAAASGAASVVSAAFSFGSVGAASPQKPAVPASGATTASAPAFSFGSVGAASPQKPAVLFGFGQSASALNVGAMTTAAAGGLTFGAMPAAPAWGSPAPFSSPSATAPGLSFAPAALSFGGETTHMTRASHWVVMRYYLG